MRKKTFYITTPIYYPNARPHMGHAYTTTICDAMARYHRLIGDETYFLTGTDENTEKVIQAAREINKEPQEYLTRVVTSFKELYDDLGISYDQFIRTSDKDVHWPGVVEMWNRIKTNGDIYKGKYKGLYCVNCESFLTEKDLIDGLCPDHRTQPKILSEENYFFRLSSYTGKIRKAIESDSIKIIPVSRKHEMLSLLDQGLEDISFSRPSSEVAWGVPVPGDPTQKMYVWMDALSNYITALGFGRDGKNMHFWPGIHVVGKDILRFHAAIWPAMLLSANMPLPRKIFVHGMIISGGHKMSKSLGNVISPSDMVKRYGTDGTRYILLRHVHPTDDSDVTWEKMDEWYNANLANGLGNLVSRIMKMAEDHLDNPIERPDVSRFDFEYTKPLEMYDIQKTTDFVWKKIGELDERIAFEEPFKIVKENPEKAQKIIKELVHELYIIGRMLCPIMPKTNMTIKQAVLENKKPKTLFPRIE